MAWTTRESWFDSSHGQEIVSSAKRPYQLCDQPSIMCSSIVLCGPGSVVIIATGYGLDGPGIESRWGGARFSAPVQIDPGAHPASCTIGTGFSPGVKSGRGVTLTPHPLLVPWSRKSRAIPLLALWAVRLVQILSACTRVHFTFLPFKIRLWLGTGAVQSVLPRLRAERPTNRGSIQAMGKR